MGSVPIFHNPYGSNGSSPAQIDRVVGTAYEVVREVAEGLEYIKHVSAHLAEIYRVSGSTDGIDFIYLYIEELSVLLDHIEEVLTVAANIDDVSAVAAEIPMLDTIVDNMAALADLYGNLDGILAHGGVVTVADTAPVTDVNGKMWWESDSGNLYTWFDDGTSGQWVQINIAAQNYDWNDLINKPSSFPPSNHSHAEDVKKAGDTMTGNLMIAPAVGIAQLILRSTGNNVNQFIGQSTDTSGVSSNRWAMLLGNTLAETGGVTGRTGADFEIKRYTNSGALIDSPMHIPRASGIPHFVNGLTAKTPPAASNDTSVATTAFVKERIDNFDDIVGNVLTLATKPVIRVVQAGTEALWSLAYGDGLAKTAHANGTTQGAYNTALGFYSLLQLTTGDYNTAGGFQSGQNITTGRFNTAFGRAALITLTTGSYNTALGQAALVGYVKDGSVGTWYGNTAVGYNALYDIKDGAAWNTGVGAGALSQPGTSILSGTGNSALGVSALHATEGGNYNSALGYLALPHVTSGNYNIGIGENAGAGISTGSGNVFIGHGIGTQAPTLSNFLQINTGDGWRLIAGSASTGVAIKGSANASSAPLGYIGEYLEKIVQPSGQVVLANQVGETVCALTLTPGDWDITGWMGYTPGAACTVSCLAGSISLAPNSADFSTPGASMVERYIPAVTANNPTNNPNWFKFPIGTRRMTISANDIVYLVAYVQFTGGMSAYGKLSARRVR